MGFIRFLRGRRAWGGKGAAKDGAGRDVGYIVTKCTPFTLWRLCGVRATREPPYNQSRVRAQAIVIVLSFSKYLAKLKQQQLLEW